MKSAALETVVVPQQEQLPEEQQPFIMYEVQPQQQVPMTEEQEMQQIIAMIQAREAAEAQAQAPQGIVAIDLLLLSLLRWTWGVWGFPYS